MGALVAILQSDPNLLRCQLRRLGPLVSLREGDALPDAYGFGYHASTGVLLGKRPTGAPAALSLPELVGRVDSEALLVHARRAVFGKAKDENTQPFRYHRWLFAHDGAVEGFEAARGRLTASLPDYLRRAINGETDSEVVFMKFLEALAAEQRIDDHDLEATAAGRALARAVRQVEVVTREVGEQRPSRLVTVATNGRVMAAVRRGGPLYYALFEGIVPCELDGITLETPESDPRVRPHRRVKAVVFATRLASTSGFIEVPEGSVVSVSRSLQVTLSPVNGNGAHA